MGSAYLPPRFTAAERLEIACREARRRVADRAFYVRQDEDRVARMRADRYASIDGRAMAEASLARHAAQHAEAVAYADELTARLAAAGIAFGKPAVVALDPALDALVAGEVAGLGERIAACTDAGTLAPAALIFAASWAVQAVRAA